MARAKHVQDHLELHPGDEAVAKAAGCWGPTPFATHLPYLDYNNAFPVPVAHAALYGVTKLLMEHLFWSGRTDERPDYAFHPDTVKLMQTRVKHVMITRDFGRQCRDPSSRGGWTMEVR